METLRIGKWKFRAANGALPQPVQVQVTGVTQSALFYKCDPNAHGENVVTTLVVFL
jgi:hypothetical protein